MKPIYKSTIYSLIQYTYKNIVTGDTSTSEEFKIYDMDNVLTHIENEFNRVDTLRESGHMIEISNVKIDSGEEIIDYSTIIGWKDVRPGDYCIHINSKNNIESDNEIGFDFYVGKLNRNHQTYVDKYYMCWHAYQGVFLITRYLEDSADKESNVDVLTIYDERLYPHLNQIELSLGRKWAYLKIAKYAQLYAIEDTIPENYSNGFEV